MSLAARHVLNRHLLVPLLLAGAPLILREVFHDRPRDNPRVRWFYQTSCRDEIWLPNLRNLARFGASLCRDIVERDYSSALPGMGKPVLILWGEGDKLVNMAGPLARLGGIPGVEVAVIPRAGHMPMVERAEETVAHIRRFIARPPVS